jgi:hypothetical protein
VDALVKWRELLSSVTGKPWVKVHYETPILLESEILIFEMV